MILVQPLPFIAFQLEGSLGKKEKYPETKALSEQTKQKTVQ